MVYTSRMKVAFLCNIVVFHFGYSTIQRKLNSSIMAKVAPRTEKKEIAAAEDSRISCTIKKRGGRERGSRDQLCKLYRGKRNIFNAEMMLLQFLAFNDNIRNKWNIFLNVLYLKRTLMKMHHCHLTAVVPMLQMKRKLLKLWYPISWIDYYYLYYLLHYKGCKNVTANDILHCFCKKMLPSRRWNEALSHLFIFPLRGQNCM